VRRKTNETSISVDIDLDGTGKVTIVLLVLILSLPFKLTHFCSRTITRASQALSR
jgi:imidazoleglycerol phosphate dehydratase HisB